MHVFFLQAAVPFAVVGSNTVVEVAGKKIRGRMYPWGIVEGTYCGRDTWSITSKRIRGRMYPWGIVEGTYCGRGSRKEDSWRMYPCGIVECSYCGTCTCIGSITGKKIRGRMYPLGIVE